MTRVCRGTQLIAITENDQCISFAVRVHPRAKRDAITGEVGDALKLSLTAPPIDGRANEACIEFFAKLLKVPRSSVTIASGLNSRNKVIRIAGVSSEFVRKQLGG
jgi:hypothetical protein